MDFLRPVPTIDLASIDCVGYLRVSSEQQAGEKQTSLADQRRAIAQLAASLGRTIGHVFEDAGMSGATTEFRPGMLSLIASCEASPRAKSSPAYVLVLNDSRWGRFEQSEESAYWRVHLEKRGWRVRFAEQDDVQDETVRPVLRAIVQSQASLYRKTLKANVLRGCRGQAEQGYWQAKAPFGYLRKVVYPLGRERVLANNVPKATDEKAILTPHPGEAPIVRAIYERYCTGTESITSLLEWASRVWPSRVWTRAAMLRLLQNPAYVGDVVWGRMINEPGRREVRSDAEWYGRENAHEPIISRALFAAAAARLVVNKSRTRAVRSDFILSGIVLCRCGRAMTGNGLGGAGPIYACGTRGMHPTRRCPYPGAVTQRLLEEAAIAAIAKEVRSSVHRRAMTKAIDHALEMARANQRTVDQIDEDRASVDLRQKRIVVAIESGALTSAEASPRLDTLRKERTRLTAERAAVEAICGGTTPLSDYRDQLVTAALDFSTMATQLQGAQLRELVRQWIKHAEFNTATRELMLEIRRVPAMAGAVGSGIAAGLLSGFEAEGDPSRSKSRTEPTVVRRVIVRRQVA